MTNEEATILNFDKLTSSIKFLLEIYKHGTLLDSLDFNDINDEHSELYGHITDTLCFLKTDKCEIVKNTFTRNTYLYNILPRIGSYMTHLNGDIAYNLAAFETYHINPSNDNVNMIVYNTNFNEWMIRIENKSSEFILKLESFPSSKNNIEYTIDIADEAAMFQYSLVNTDIPDYIYNIALRAHRMFDDTLFANKFLLKNSGCIVDLRILDLKEEYDKIKE